MSSPPPSPDRFQREIDDIVRLAERRLERQQRTGAKAQRSKRPERRAWSGFTFTMPRAETLAGWAMALLLLSMLMGMLGLFPSIAGIAQIVGIALLLSAIVLSLTRGRTAAGMGGGPKVWRGETVHYGSPYGPNSLLNRLRRFLSGRR